MGCTDFLDRYNALVGGIIAVASTMLGIHWYVFAGYLLCNVLDWLTGWHKSRYLGTESSMKGLQGIVKKLGYWAIVLISFLIPEIFIKMGRDILHIDLGFLLYLGWFTLASLLINEIRSIIENLVECGYEVPYFLIKGLAVTEKLLKAKTGDDEKEED